MIKENSIEWLYQQLWEMPKDKLTWYALKQEAKRKYEDEMFDSIKFGGALVRAAEDITMERMTKEFEILREKYTDENGKIHADNRNKTD